MKSDMINRLIFTFLLALFAFITTDVLAQSFIKKESAHYYKYEIALDVLKKIAKAKGDNKPLPILKISTKKAYVAEFKPNQSNSTIILDEYIYDVCASFGSDSLNALACVLGHELGHYFLNHSGGFGYSNTKPYTQEHVKLVEIERNADEFGVFYGFLAGYDTRTILPKILDRIYTSYNLNSELTGYPSLDERKDIADNSIKNTTELGHVFTFGKLLYGINKAEEAANCFEYIVPQFPSKEIYNNIGVIYLREYISKDFESDSNSKFIYPVEFDPESRLLKERLRSSDFDSWIPELDVIAEYFEKALQLDDSYAEASINLATTYVLKDNYDLSSGLINQLENKLESKGENIPESAFSIRGISKALSGNYTKAEENFNHVITDNDINKYNKHVLNALQNKETSYFDNFYNWVASFFEDEKLVDKKTCGAERICDVDLNKITLDDDFVYKDLDGYEDIAYKENRDCTIYCILKNNQIQFSIIKAGESYSGKTTKGLSIGANENEIFLNYGTPSQILSFKNERMYIYFDYQISFILEDGQIKNWFVWSK